MCYISPGCVREYDIDYNDQNDIVTRPPNLDIVDDTDCANWCGREQAELQKVTSAPWENK